LVFTPPPTKCTDGADRRSFATSAISLTVVSSAPFGRRNFMKNDGLKRIFNDLGTFFDPVS